MQNIISQYEHSVTFSDKLPDETALEFRLFELGLEREAFSISRTDLRSARLTFWEPDRFEAIRLIARLETIAQH